MKSELCLVTGANGFIGSSLCMALVHLGRQVVPAMRCTLPKWAREMSGFRISAMNSDTDWRRGLQGCCSVIHCAALVHVMRNQVAGPLHAYREVNVGGTLNMARQAAALGVKRFVFLSSIKVNGEQSPIGHAFTSSDVPNPVDPYGVSKHEAEEGLRRIAAQTGMEVVIIRPVLVYGPGVKGNFLSMMHWLENGIPLPLGAIDNMRSLVALDNLIDLIVTCLSHPAAANQTFLVSDGKDISTTELLNRTASALGVKAHLLPVPAGLLTAGAWLVGKRSTAQRLLGSLQVDITKTRDLLGWNPPVSVDEGLRRAVGGI